MSKDEIEQEATLSRQEHGEEIELEIELKWSASGAGRDRPYARANT